MSTDKLEQMRGVANFYRTSTNMGDTVTNVQGVDGSFKITADDLDWAADEIERLRRELVALQKAVIFNEAADSL